LRHNIFILVVFGEEHSLIICIAQHKTWAKAGACRSVTGVVGVGRTLEVTGVRLAVLLSRG
jgi:hypothetical protein